MAHKIKVKPVPHIKRDGTVGTKKDYRVVCKRRGHVCTDQTFTLRRDAEEHVAKHWEFVNRRKGVLADLLDWKRTMESQFVCRATAKPKPDITEFTNSTSTSAPRTEMTGAVAA